jgi:hypothetical protein
MYNRHRENEKRQAASISRRVLDGTDQTTQARHSPEDLREELPPGND